MAKVWLIARHQFWQEASKRSFLLVLLSMPLFLSFTIGVGFLAAQLEQESTTFGYVDQAGILADFSLDSMEDGVALVPYDSRKAAQAALDAEQINAYYMIEADYRDTRDAELIYVEQPDSGAMREFEEIVRVNLVANQDPGLAQRMLAGVNLTVRATETGREYEGGGPSVALFLPLVAAVLFVFLMLTTSGYMTSVVIEEKANRTIEIVVTSLSAGRMMAGKLLGALGIAVVQLAVWLTFLVGAVWVGGQLLDIEWLQGVAVNWRDIAMIVMVSLPAYFFVAAMMTLVGSMLTDANEAQQAAAIPMIFLFLPFYVIIPILRDPNGPLSLAFSFFPPTSLMTIAMRSVLSVVPAWQIAVAATLSLIGGIFLAWQAGRAFRMTMLRYGQRLKLRELFRRDGGGRPAELVK